MHAVKSTWKSRRLEEWRHTSYQNVIFGFWNLKLYPKYTISAESCGYSRSKCDALHLIGKLSFPVDRKIETKETTGKLQSFRILGKLLDNSEENDLVKK